MALRDQGKKALPVGMTSVSSDTPDKLRRKLQQPEWGYWTQRGTASLPQAVLLSLDIEPRQFERLDEMRSLNRYDLADLERMLEEHDAGLGVRFRDRLDIAKNELERKSWHC